MNCDNLGIAVIGLGRAGMIHAKNFSGAISRARIVALADSNPDTLKLAAQELNVAAAFTDFREALKHPAVDAVVIAAPTSHHCEIAIAAAAAGKHILCEK